MIRRNVNFADRRVIVIVFTCVFSSILFTVVFFSTYPHLRPAIHDWLPIPATHSTPSTGFTPPPKNPTDPDVVELDYLSFRPKKSETVKTFWNIPYAASAGGKNRFRAPQPVPWRTKETMEWSGKLGMCPRIQKIDSTLRNREDVASPDVPGWEAEISEDCLSLNVFTPIDAEAGDELPVLVVIPGGGFHLPGRSNCGAMVEKSRIEKDGKFDKGIICITMYYRNGIYGFLSGDQIQEDGDFNNGLKDQRATLEWVQKYIRYFGGNPDRVVIMGTSAGGASAVLHLTANGGDNTFATPGRGRTQLFHGVIAQSPASPTFYTPEQANKFWKQVALGLNCTDLSVECVRNASVGDLYYQNYPMNFPNRNTPPRWMWAPTTERKGGMWTEPATGAILAGRYAKVPTIFGYTTNEGSDQVKKTTDTLGEFKSYLQDHYPLLTDDDLELLGKNYPNDRHWPDSGRYWDAVAKAQGDIRYICPTYLASNAMAGYNPSNVSTWQYQWDVIGGPDGENGFGTKHAGSVGLVMSPPKNAISDYFISFVKHLDPNVDKNTNMDDMIAWDRMDVKNPKRMFFSNRADQKQGIKLSLPAPDPARDARCNDIRKLMGRLQQEAAP